MTTLVAARADIVDEPEPLTRLGAASRKCVDLSEIRILGVLRRVERRGYEVAHGLIRLVRERVSSLGAGGKVDDVAGVERADAVTGPKSRPAVEHDEELLRRVVKVERNPVARAELIHGCTELLAARKALAASSPARPVLAGIPLVGEDVGVAHAWRSAGGLSARR